MIADNLNKLLLTHSSSGHKHSIREILSNPVGSFVNHWHWSLIPSFPFGRHFLFCNFILFYKKAIQEQLCDTKASSEVAALNEFFRVLGTDSDRATYGYKVWIFLVFFLLPLLLLFFNNSIIFMNKTKTGSCTS